MAVKYAVNGACSIFSCSADGIIRDCYEYVSWSNETNFCDCAIFPGWVGPNCDQVSPELIHSRVWNVFSAIGLICLAFLLVVDIFRLFYIQNYIGGENHVHPPLSLYVAAFATLSCYIGHFVYACILAKSAFDPAATEAFNGFSAIRVKNIKAAFVFLNLVLGSAMIAELQTTLTWLDITEKTRGFTAFKFGKWKTAVVFYKIFAQVATLFSLLLAIIFATTLNDFAMHLTIIVVVSIVTGFLIIGRIHFVSVLRAVGGDSISSDYFKKPIKLVRKTSFYVLVVSFLCIGALMVQVIVVKTAEIDLPPGDFSFQELLGNISFFSAYCFFAVYHWYIHQLTHTFSARKWKFSNNKKKKHPVNSTSLRQSNGKDNHTDKVLAPEITL